MGSSYPQILRGPAYAWWRSVLGVVMGVSLFLLITPLIGQVVVGAAWAVSGRTVAWTAYATSAFAFQRPSGMLAANLGIAALIPIAAILVVVVHTVQPRWLASVLGRVRWPYLLACAGIAVLALNGVLALSALAAPAVSLRMQPGFWGFLVVIVLTSPLQAAAEEVFFRGYLMQALGSLFAQPWVGVVLSSVVFALFHGVQNGPLFADRLAFGLLAAMLVWRTGGLEAGIAAHVVNNLCAYVFAGLTGSIAATKAIRAIGWADAAFDVGGFALFAVLAWLLARRFRLANRVPATAVPV